MKSLIQQEALTLCRLFSTQLRGETLITHQQNMQVMQLRVVHCRPAHDSFKGSDGDREQEVLNRGRPWKGGPLHGALGKNKLGPSEGTRTESRPWRDGADQTKLWWQKDREHVRNMTGIWGVGRSSCQCCQTLLRRRQNEKWRSLSGSQEPISHVYSLYRLIPFSDISFIHKVSYTLNPHIHTNIYSACIHVYYVVTTQMSI